MKQIAILLFLLAVGVNGIQAQAGVNESVSEITTVIDTHTPDLTAFGDELTKHRKELEERAIVLKYHKGNKEVTEKTNSAIARIEEYNNAARQRVQEFESEWYDQMPKVIEIYTRYGEMKEASGGGATDLDDFRDKHRSYMDIMDQVRQDIAFISADCAYLRQ